MEHRSPDIVVTAQDRSDLTTLGDRIAEMSAHLDAATAQLLDLIRDFDERLGWNNGFASCAAWLSWRVGLDPGAARERVRVARALVTLPAIAAALARGEVSYAKVRAITRVATPETEATLLNVAKIGTAAHVEQIVRGWRRVDRIAEAREARHQHRSRTLHVFQDEDGMVTVQGVGKRLQLLKDAVPRLRTVAAIAIQKPQAIEREGARLGLQIRVVTARTPGEIDAAFATVRTARPEALLVYPHPMFWLERRRIARLASETGLPAIYENADFVEAGGLMAYGASLVDMARRAAGYIDRILKGARPADLPVEQPIKFELVINLKTARALGLAIPPALLARADRLIE